MQGNGQRRTFRTKWKKSSQVPQLTCIWSKWAGEPDYKRVLKFVLLVENQSQGQLQLVLTDFWRLRHIEWLSMPLKKAQHDPTFLVQATIASPWARQEMTFGSQTLFATTSRFVVWTDRARPGLFLIFSCFEQAKTRPTKILRSS